MRTVTVCVAMAILLVGAGVLAQELIATPDPVGGAKTDAGAGTIAGDQAHPTPAANAAAATAANNWRYRWHNGRWWYWTSQNRWMWYSDDGHWVAYEPNHSPPVAVEGSDAPATYDGYNSYPGPVYWNGYYRPYYPGVAVGVGPYGNVGVGVGRRVGVDVWGPHGGVRVGRIYVGW
jgi:hypothetical protein